MDKVALRNFAVNAKEKMEKEVRRKLELIGITKNKIEEGIVSENDYLKIGNVELNKREIKQREILVKTLKEKVKEGNFQDALNELIEEIAYTWFNRIIAIRFMEVNDYLNDRIRILSSERENDREPQIIREVFNTDLEFSDDEKNYVYNLKEESKTEELFRFLFIKKCNKLNEILPELFEEAEDYSELLLPISINDEEGILRKLVDGVPKESFDIKKEGQIEVIGWLYQYYNEEKKKEVDKKTKKGKKVEQDDIPAKTQLFTPKWIVKYMVENSLGNLWLEGHPNENLEEKWKFLVKREKQEEEIEGKLEKLNENYKEMNLEEIKIIDPCMGSGHILVYAFDVLMDIYSNLGYSNRDAVQSILENNIYGLDIDKRAYQLAYFALMMKAREYYKRIFSKKLELNICYTRESNDINKEIIDFISNGNNKIKEELDLIYNLFLDAREYGSLIEAPKIDYDKIKNRLSEIENTDSYNLFDEGKKDEIKNKFYYVLKTSEILSKKYEVVATNPPYMGSSMMDSKLSKYTKKNYPDSKSDMFAVFIEKCNSLTDRNGFCSMITMHGWMFLSSYERLREKMALIETLNMVHLGTRAFDEIGGEVVQTTAWIQRKNKINNFKGSYIRLVDFPGEENKRNKFLEIVRNKDKKYYFRTTKENFEKIPGMPIGYWVSDNVRNVFVKAKGLAHYAETRLGMATADNEKFLRIWHEANILDIGFNIENREKALESKKKWFPYSKGGEFRKWYGNFENIVNWKNDGFEILNFKDSNGKIRSHNYNLEFIFNEGLTWSALSSSLFSIRKLPIGFLFDNSGSSLFQKEKASLNYLLFILNNKVISKFLELINSTLNYQPGNLNKIPIIYKHSYNNEINLLVQQNIDISKKEWDSRETSWDFEKLSLIEGKDLKSTFENYCSHWRDNFVQLHKNEEELNRLFIEIYELQNEMDEKIEFKDITILQEETSIIRIDNSISKEFLTESEKYLYDRGVSLEFNKNVLIKQFISYAVGCMFGRYSLDEEGLVFAGGEFDKNKYSKFIPDEDNCIPITDSEYFSDDIVKRFVEFVKTVYGEETLEENLKFIAQALSNKNDAPKDIIREYFLKSFYDDHLKRYKKRPIYWLYDAGKKNGFKALIYMHRYNEQTTAKVRIGYLHELQKHYERRASFLKDEIESDNNRKKAEKELKKIKSQLDECKHFDEKMNHLASEYISIDLDDGVKVNYEKVQTGRDGKKYEILGKVK